MAHRGARGQPLTAISIYVEGGGDRTSQRATLRRGLDALLQPQKKAAQAKRLGWKVVPCGGRNATSEAFRNAYRKARRGELCVLLVDSEEPIKTSPPDPRSSSRKDHLRNRDGWDLAGISPETIHLMVQCMEAWIAADPEALEVWYGSKFSKNKLPTRQNLEEVPKPELYKKLVSATKSTAKGAYSDENHAKLGHAPKLLEQIDPGKVRKRCPHFELLTEWLEARIAETSPE